ncbi:glyoxalase [Herbiconiux sp. CPCC 205763]|uniref:Glyoxalase n=1 Tax=Herbiconiux aconitum TaxID=2970913 RepID=A0ABT2GUV8_9MICO|nr:glyoxalase [Herbiconiux aconitum]MCS5719999.1 glyoxalase [Herbiconiux aconitum]
MTTIDSITLDVPDAAAAETFYAAFALGDRLRVRQAGAADGAANAAATHATSGFRGYTLSITVFQPATVHALIDAAVAAGATVLRPVAKSLWGVGGSIQAPDGAIWKVATTAKKDTDPSDRRIDTLVLLLGVDDVSASKKFYVEHGLEVGKSFGKYVEFALPSSPVKLGLYSRKALAKDAGVPPEGSSSHGLAIAGDAGAFTDPDGFAWTVSLPTPAST